MVTKIASATIVTMIRRKLVRLRVESSGGVGSLFIQGMLACPAGSCVCQKRSFWGTAACGATTPWRCWPLYFGSSFRSQRRQVWLRHHCIAFRKPRICNSERGRMLDSALAHSSFCISVVPRLPELIWRTSREGLRSSRVTRYRCGSLLETRRP